MAEPIIPAEVRHEQPVQRIEAAVKKNILYPPNKGPEIMSQPWERAILREPRNKKVEIKQFVEIERCPAMKEMNEGPDDAMRPDEFPGWFKRAKSLPERTVKAITTKTKDKVRGWFRVDQGTPEEGQTKSQEQLRFERITGQKMAENELDPAELAYIILPHGEKGLLESAVMTGISMVEQRDQAIAGDHPPRKLIVYQEPPTKAWQEAYDCLAACGFEQATKELVGYDADSTPDTHMYVLNWDKFRQIREQRSVSQTNTDLSAARSAVAAAAQIKQ